MATKQTPYNPIDNKVEDHIRKILEGGFQQAALGTVDNKGYPMVTKIVPMLHIEVIYLLLSDLSEHTKNLYQNKMASIYFAEKESHKIKSNNPRLTLQGTLQKLNFKKNEPQFQGLLKHYNKIEPGAKMWAMFADFNFYSFKQERMLFVEGFGKAYESKSKEVSK